METCCMDTRGLLIGLAAQTIFRIEAFKFDSPPFAFKGPIQAAIDPFPSAKIAS